MFTLRIATDDVRENPNRTQNSHVNFPATATALRNIVLCMSSLFETPQIIKTRLPVACQEVRRGAKIIAFFRCYTWRLRQNRVAATERDEKRGNNWTTQRFVNCGVHSLEPAWEHVETYRRDWKTLNLTKKAFNTRQSPVSFNSEPTAIT